MGEWVDEGKNRGFQLPAPSQRIKKKGRSRLAMTTYGIVCLLRSIQSDTEREASE